MAAWKLLLVAAKAQRTWKRIPPEQRRKLVENAAESARRHGPVVARRLGRLARRLNKPQ